MVAQFRDSTDQSNIFFSEILVPVDDLSYSPKLFRMFGMYVIAMDI